MKTKEEIVKWHTHNLSAFSLATYKKPVYDAMQEYADQECAAKDNEISRLNGIITEQQRLSNLVSGDLQNAKKEIQELMENISELDKLKLDTLINLRIENASLRAELKKKEDDYMVRISSVLAENDNLIIEKNAFRAEVERLKAEIARRDQPENFHCNPG